MQQAQKYTLWLALGSAALLIFTLIFGWEPLIAPCSVITAIGLAYGIGAIESLKGYQYTVWIIVAIVCGMMYPNAFLQWGEFDLRNKWLILIVVQVVMFGMGTQMSLRDFTGIRTMGKGVLVGILCQFSIMPVTGYVLTRFFDFEPEIAAGVILIGSCSSGLASNVMVFIAKANLTLSVTLTAVATLLAPIMTPFLMKVLAGTYVKINFLDMCIQIVKIVIVPIGSAMLFEYYKESNRNIRNRINIIFCVACAWLLAMLAGLWRSLGSVLGDQWMLILELVNFLCGSIIVGVVYYHGNKLLPQLHGFMPKLSMFGIVYFTTVTTAASRENILTIGLFLLLASIIHNALGYTFGYGISRGLGLDRESARTVALEVGLQNGGMASGLAGVMGKLATLGLASAVFSPWMNISGSLLANYWRKKS
ncbi:bile acid:sodium symporter family protein [Marinoscillum sp. MHG1-6]|uniref:bile acid:sodium symporter family protein n=1 Tax=Marinoscillum sp. MHG1-6 TaxID=2959627 RepID=UPI002156FCA7|nr:bile acid:sodium symporter family protein [Marinoscillum sp. MHG1-6]